MNHLPFNTFYAAARNGLPVTFEYRAASDGKVRVRVGYVEKLMADYVVIKDVIVPKQVAKDGMRTCRFERIEGPIEILGSRNPA